MARLRSKSWTAASSSPCCSSTIPEPVRHPGQRSSGVGGGHLDRLLEPPPSLPGVTADVPELAERLDQPQADGHALAVGWIGRLRSQRPAQGGAQVVVVGLDPVEAGELGRADELGAGPLRRISA